MAINESDFSARGWDVVPAFAGAAHIDDSLLEEMSRDPEVAGESSWGTRNMLMALVLSLKPKTVLEIGSHIGSGAVVIGSALRANGFGTCYSLEPADHYFEILNNYIRKAELGNFVRPLKKFSTDHDLKDIVGGGVDMVFLDANHSYSHALRDLEISYDLIPENGIICFDDVGPKMSPDLCSEGRGGVRQAIVDFVARKPDLNVIFFEPPFWLNPCGFALACKQNVLPKSR